MTDVALDGVRRVTQTFAPAMEEGGSIVNISSLAARLAMENLPAYSAAKGVEAFTRASAKELAPDVRVNAIAPGFFITHRTPTPTPRGPRNGREFKSERRWVASGSARNSSARRSTSRAMRRRTSRAKCSRSTADLHRVRSEARSTSTTDQTHVWSSCWCEPSCEEIDQQQTGTDRLLGYRIELTSFAWLIPFTILLYSI